MKAVSTVVVAENCASENERQLPHPYHFIDEAARAGEDKNEPNDGFDVSHA